MNIRESTIDQETLANIAGCALDAATILDVNLLETTPTDAVAAVDLFVHRWQQGDQPVISEDDDLSLVMGSLWGEQLVKEFDWQWAAVTFPDHPDDQVVGVVSPDRSLAIYPFHFVQECLKNEVPVTIQLAFDILADRSRVPDISAGTFENVMDNVHHAEPRI